MIAKPRFTLMAVAVSMVLALSAMMAVPVFADDSAPPPPADTPTEVVPPADEPAVVDAPPAEEPVPAEVVPAEAVPGETAPAEATITEVLEQAPEGTDVQVIGTNGESLPLASQEAADVLATGDPIWCPVGIAPKSGVGGCSASYTSLQSLINDLLTAGGSITNPAKAGVIWIEGWNPLTSTGYNSSINDAANDSFVLDGDDFDDGDLVFTDTMDNFALTIKGGWNGVAGSTVINQSTPSLFSGDSLSIINWKGAITLSDIVFDGATSSSGVDDSALLVETTGNIQLDRVTVKDSENGGAGVMTGATLDNSASAKAATVIVNNGAFENNEADGLRIFSAGIVTVTTLYANGNDGSGAVIDNCKRNPGANPDPLITYDDFCEIVGLDKAVTLKGSLEFHNNAGDGLTVSSKGLITLSNVIAQANGANGVTLDNTLSLTKLGVTLGGTNSFVSNADGLYVRTHGAFTANNITATDNGGSGAYLDNCDVTLPTGFCITQVAKTFKLTGYNYFNNNGNHGVEIYSLGAISISNLTTAGNGNTGAIIDNKKPNFPLTSGVVQVDSIGTITLTGYGRFDNNGDLGGGDGLQVLSHGNISLTTLTANNNAANGVSIYADRTNIGTTIYVSNVTITGSNFFIENGLDGLHIDADGKVSVSNVTANHNTDDGVEIYTNYIAHAGHLSFTPDPGYGAVVLTGTNTFMDNDGTGLFVYASGTITAGNVSSLYNQTGASLNNQYNNLKVYAVSLSGTNSFNFNDLDGLLVDSYGAITINNLKANGNGVLTPAPPSGNGATLDNCNYNTGTSLCIATTASVVTLNGYVNASNNYFRGLQIDSLGAVTVNNVAANGNLNVGVRIQNQYNKDFNKLIVRGVTINGTNNFYGNDSTGLYVLSYGAITLSNINANNNGDDSPGSSSGAVLNNEVTGTTITAKNITITGVNSFSGNYLWGLQFYSNGTATLSRISANGNDWGVANDDSTIDTGHTGGGVLGTAKTITLTCGHMFGNGIPPIPITTDTGVVGYNLTATGVLTFKGIYSSGNKAADLQSGSSIVTTKACALP